MTEELQGLLARIQQDGVEKADEKAAAIVSTAETKAKEMIAKAKDDAAALVAKAEEDSKVFAERAAKSLQQAARDVILSVGDSVSEAMSKLVDAKTSEALTTDVMKQMMLEIAKSYGKSEGGIEMLVSEKDQAELRDALMAEFAKAAQDGIEIRGSGDIIGGFVLSVKDAKAHHNFTQKAIADSLCQLVRPHLAEIVRGAFK